MGPKHAKTYVSDLSEDEKDRSLKNFLSLFSKDDKEDLLDKIKRLIRRNRTPSQSPDRTHTKQRRKP
jgi:hypothetical protein